MLKELKEVELMILSNFKEPHNTGLIVVEEGHHLENQNFFFQRETAGPAFFHGHVIGYHSC